MLAAGTSDGPVAGEVALTARAYGAAVERVDDVGVAGLHRLLAARPALERADCVVVVAGMDGALPSVVGGLVGTPLVAVPTSVGYGAALRRHRGAADHAQRLRAWRRRGQHRQRLRRRGARGADRPPGQPVIGWLDAGAGASGDMLLGALVDAGVPLAVLQQAVDAVGVEPVHLRSEPVERAGLGATRVHVEVADTAASRTWSDVRALLEAADLAEPVRATALAAFARLADAEAAVHRVPAEDVHFHEVGALDAVADVVGTAAGLHALGLASLTCSTVSLGSGTTRGAHGPLPVPAPAVLALLAGAPVQAGPAAHEATTPTGAALLATAVTGWGGLPAMTVDRVGVGAGGRDRPEVANVLRLVLGDAGRRADGRGRARVHGRRPRPAAVAARARAAAGGRRPGRLADAGAHEEGPPGPRADRAVRAGPRRRPAPAGPGADLARSGCGRAGSPGTCWTARRAAVDVGGRDVRVKLGLLDGEVVNRSVEWEDVAAAAAALGRPAKQVLAEAERRAQELGQQPAGPSPEEGGARPGVLTSGAARP